MPVPLWHWWLSSLLPVWGGVGPMWWHWVTWCGCPAVPADVVGVFPLVAPRVPWKLGDAVGLFLDPSPSPLCLSVPVCLTCDVTTCAVRPRLVRDIQVARTGSPDFLKLLDGGLDTAGEYKHFVLFTLCSSSMILGVGGPLRTSISLGW